MLQAVLVTLASTHEVGLTEAVLRVSILLCGFSNRVSHEERLSESSKLSENSESEREAEKETVMEKETKEK